MTFSSCDPQGDIAWSLTILQTPDDLFFEVSMFYDLLSLIMGVLSADIGFVMCVLRDIPPLDPIALPFVPDCRLRPTHGYANLGERIPFPFQDRNLIPLTPRELPEFFVFIVFSFIFPRRRSNSKEKAGLYEAEASDYVGSIYRDGTFMRKFHRASNWRSPLAQ